MEIVEDSGRPCMSMVDMMQSLDTLAFDSTTADMVMALDEISEHLWLVTMPVNNVIRWIRDHQYKSFPRKKNRWINQLQSQFRYNVVSIPTHRIDSIQHTLEHAMASPDVLKLYHYIISNARHDPKQTDLTGISHVTVMIECNADVLYNELCDRGIITEWNPSSTIDPTRIRTDINWRKVNDVK